MNKRIPTFLAGMLTAALIGTLSIGALAATGQLTIEVNPINVQVNGETFQPKDAQGKDVPVFSYNGTTYAPLRALAEAYGLEVGYDAGKNMATVGAVTDPATTPAPDTALSDDYSTWSKEDEAAYQEFKGMCSVTPLSEPEKLYANPSKIYAGIELPLSDTTQYNIDCRYDLKETAELRTDEQVSYWNKNIKDIQVKYAERLTKEIHANNPRKSTAIVFRWRDLTTMVTAMYGGGTYVSEVCVKE